MARFDEGSFREWYQGVSDEWDLDPNPDDYRHYYDWRKAWGAGAKADEEGHWPSEFKHPDHPNRYVDGIDTITGKSRHLDIDALDAQIGAVDEDELLPHMLPKSHPRYFPRNERFERERRERKADIEWEGKRAKERAAAEEAGERLELDRPIDLKDPRHMLPPDWLKFKQAQEAMEKFEKILREKLEAGAAKGLGDFKRQKELTDKMMRAILEQQSKQIEAQEERGRKIKGMELKEQQLQERIERQKQIDNIRDRFKDGATPKFRIPEGAVSPGIPSVFHGTAHVDQDGERLQMEPNLYVLNGYTGPPVRMGSDEASQLVKGMKVKYRYPETAPKPAVQTGLGPAIVEQRRRNAQ